MAVTCTICKGRIFNSMSAYEMHAKTSKAHFTYTCSICKESFPSMFARSGHLLRAHQNLHCKQCNRYYLSTESLQKHYTEDPAHPSCPECRKGFADTVVLGAHRVTEHPKPLFPCVNCHINFDSQVQLTQHWSDSNVHPNCLTCNQGFQDASSFNEHVQQTHPELWCGACMMGFQSAEQLLDHFMQSDTAVHPTCSICGEGFETQAIFDEHTAVRHAPPPPTPPPPTPMSVQSVTSTIRCTQCARTYRRDEDLLRHYKDSPAHPKCIPCNLGFACDQEHDTHLSEVHPHPASGSSQTSTADATPVSRTPVISQLEISTETSTNITSPVPPTEASASPRTTTESLDFHEQIAAIERQQRALYEQQLERNRVLAQQATTIRAAASSLSSIRSAISTPRSGSPWDIGSEAQYAAQPASKQATTIHTTASSLSSVRSAMSTPRSGSAWDFGSGTQYAAQPASPRTDVPEYASKGREMQPSPMAQRAASEPTPTLPTPSSLDQPTPVSPSFPLSSLDRPTSISPSSALSSPHTIPMRSPRSDAGSVGNRIVYVDYSSRASTPERLRSPSSLASPPRQEFVPCSPELRTAAAPSKRMSPLEGPSLQSSRCASVLNDRPPTRTPSPPPSMGRSPMHTPVPPVTTASSRAPTRTPSRSGSVSESVTGVRPYTRSMSTRRPSVASATSGPASAAREVSTASPRPVSMLSTPVSPSAVTTAPEPTRMPSRVSLNPPSSPEGSDLDGGPSGSSRTAATPPPERPSPNSRRKAAPPRAAPAKGLAWHCRLCMGEPCDPTVTVCGHLFCHACIVQELAKNLQCPVCRRAMLVRLHVEDV